MKEVSKRKNKENKKLLNEQRIKTLVESKLKEIDETEIIFDKYDPVELAVILAEISKELSTEIKSESFFENDIIYKSDITQLFIKNFK